MLNQRGYLRDVALLAFAGVLGWWAHGANSNVVRADAARSDDNLAFQFGGAGLEGSLTLYNRDNHTLYVYPSAINKSHIDCAFSIRVDRAGAALERQNCPAGSAFGH